MQNILWKKIWDEKGKSESEDFLYLDGYDHLNIEISSKKICDNIINSLNITKEDYVLEVGCGAGFLSKNMDCLYTGIDYSQTIIEKNRKLTKKNSFVCEANNIFFPNNSFDYTFCFGLLQYLPNKEYFLQTISEMKRVSKKGFFLGDIKEQSNNINHFICPKEFFVENNFTVTEQIYDYKDNVRRFNAYIKF